MNEAIKLAIEKGGYAEYGTYCENFDMYESTGGHCENAVVLDPLFWQALSKALGLKEHTKTVHYQTWYLNAKEYFHLLLTGGNTEKFLKELLNPQPSK